MLALWEMIDAFVGVWACTPIIVFGACVTVIVFGACMPVIVFGVCVPAFILSFLAVVPGL